jgi:hypothetical protein
MTLKEKLFQSSFYLELKSNNRLQWLMLSVLVILLFDISDTLLSSLEQKQTNVVQQLAYLTKLKSIENTPYDEEQAEQLNQKLQTDLRGIETASSISIAEASALDLVEKRLSKPMKRMRLNLIGSEPVEAGNQGLWNVRIDVAGQVEEQSLISVLKLLDRSNTSWRVASLQYSPKASGSISFVLDILYKEKKDDE